MTYRLRGFGLLLLAASLAGQSLGDVARAEKAKKDAEKAAEAAKPARVITDADIGHTTEKSNPKPAAAKPAPKAPPKPNDDVARLNEARATLAQDRDKLTQLQKALNDAEVTRRTQEKKPTGKDAAEKAARDAVELKAQIAEQKKLIATDQRRVVELEAVVKARKTTRQTTAGTKTS